LFNLGVFLMKKTLIAMAVLAASGASFAQVSITGAISYGYRTTTGATGSNAGGFGLDGSALTFAAKEDLGGGMSADASLSFDGINRAGVGGGDSSLSLAGGFGKLAFAQGRGSDYLSGGTAGVGGVTLDDKVFSILTASETITYTLPTLVQGVTVGFNIEEGYATRTIGESATVLGLGAGAAGAAPAGDYQRNSAVSVGYAAGALAVNAKYQAYDHSEILENSKYRFSVRGAYDLGLLKVGAGFRNTELQGGATRQDTFFAVGVPVSAALTLGANYGQRVGSGYVAATSNYTKTGSSVNAVYALSKRTALNVSMARWDTSSTSANQSTENNITLSHSF
jgi:hypothetical protein